MLRFNNLSIGTKLGITSGVGVALVLCMMVALIYGDAGVKDASENAYRQSGVVGTTGMLKASVRGMQIGVRDTRLAATASDLKKADDYLAERLKSSSGYVDELLRTLRVPANRERAAKIQDLIKQYDSAARELSALRSKIVELIARSGPAPSPEVAAQIRELNQQAVHFASERTLPLAAELDRLTTEISDSAQTLAKASVQTANSEMESVERINVGLGILLAIVLVGAVAISLMTIARPIRRLIDVLKEIEKGNTQVEVAGTGRADEIGSLAKAVVVIRASRDAEMANSRVKTGLDVVRSNVMLADDQYNIIYMNNSLQQMMREAESELRKALPGFDSSRLIGADMDTFHKNPAHQRSLVSSLRGSYESHITVGTQKFHLVATSVQDKDGKRSGTVVEWRNETVEKAIEAEIDGLVQAAIAGDFSQRVPTEGKKEFMLALATAMNGLCENIASAVEDLARVLSALAQGNLTQRITKDYQGAFARLKTDANATAEQLSETIGDIKTAAREVNNAAAEISASTTDLSQRTEEQAASLEQTSASMEQISATVKKNAENAQQANQLTASSREVANSGGTVVADAVKAMARIEESSRKIADIIGVIDEIARQTNLLALNAAVEAARAGDAGRGFAVVASEVRSLAQRSSQAAKDIKDLITNSSTQVQDGVGLVNQAGTSLNEIVASIKQVAEIVADIATASAEQAEGLEQINKALAQMDEVTQQNSALVEENAASAKALEHQSTTMDERVAFFQLDGRAAGERGRERVSEPGVGAAKAPAAATAPRPKLVTAAGGKSAPRPAAKASADAGKGPVARMQSQVATAFKQEPDWKEF